MVPVPGMAADLYECPLCGAMTDTAPVDTAQVLWSDPFCGGCGAPSGRVCRLGCGRSKNNLAGGVLLLALHVPGDGVVDADPGIVAREFAAIINEERTANGGSENDVSVATFPAVEWMTLDTFDALRAALAADPTETA